MGLLLTGVPGALAQDGPIVPVSSRIMPWTPEEAQNVMGEHLSAPPYPTFGKFDNLPTSVNLYPLLRNVPSQRNQGSCGNCWAWGSTGVMEIALNVQNGIYDRLSVQFINSCNPYKACCAAGGLQDIVNFYRYEGFAIPWSNPYAGFSSGDGNCDAAPCGNIVTSPRYPISSISLYSINTWSGQATAIANIKTALIQNKGLYFFFYLPNTAAWNAFDNFYFSQPESVVWTNYYCGSPTDGGSGGHVVLCLGYYDDDGANRYWIMLNSWGPTSGRPTGFFRVGMTVDYDCSQIGFETLNMSYALAPVITSQPQSRTNLAGTTATFTVATAPGTPLTYQWKKDGTNVINGGRISGATSAALTISNVETNDAGNYNVALNYGPGTINSAAARLTVIVPPGIIAQPQSQSITQGGYATFTVTAAGTEPLSYRWQFNGTTYAPGTNTFVTSKPGDYSVIVSNLAGVVTSAVATLTVLIPPQIVVQPQSQTNLAGVPVTFSVSATGTAPLIYRWQRDGTTYPPGTNTFTTQRAGNYSVTVSNAAGAVVSDTVSLVTTNPPPARPGLFETIALQPDGSLQLNMSATPWTNYVLQCTSNWVDWTDLGTLCATNGLFQYTDPAATSAGQRFYRLRLGP